MPGPLTKKAKINTEQRRISQLTHPHRAHFKVILSHQVEPAYDFSSVQRFRRREGLDDVGELKIFRALTKFLDDSLRLSITEVEKKYKRPSDPRDGTFDPETGSDVQVEHFCLFVDGTPPDVPADSVRVHGYFRANGGYFVVTRMDWFHNQHS